MESALLKTHLPLRKGQGAGARPYIKYSISRCAFQQAFGKIRRPSHEERRIL